MKNIRVMLVDDEVLAVEYLRNIIPWEEYGFEIAAEATNGKKALEELLKHRPQVIFVDIRMPVMDGLEFSKRAVESGIPLKIILLTAYKDFDYARQAIEIGVTNYILKHDINKQTILNELVKIRNELFQEEKNKRIIRQKYYRDLIRGYKPSESGDDFRKGEKYGSFLLILLRIDQPYCIAEEFVYQAGYFPISAVDINSLEFPQFVDYFENIEVDETRYALILSIKKIYSRLEIISGINELSRKIQKKFKEVYDSTVSVVVSDILINVESLHSEYERLSRVIDLGIFYGKERIYMSDCYPVPAEINQDGIEYGKQMVSRALDEMKPEGLEPGLDMMFAAVFLSLNGLKRICSMLILILDEYNRKYNQELLEDRKKRGYDEFICGNDVKEIKSWFLKEFSLLTDRAVKLKCNAYSKKIQQAVAFIRKNYGTDISVEQVAKEIDISSVYLMKLFQKEVGQTFLEYLTSCRVEIAKKLICEGNYKIYEISEMVGYKSSQYFSQVFKKLTGKNPIDLQRR